MAHEESVWLARGGISRRIHVKNSEFRPSGQQMNGSIPQIARIAERIRLGLRAARVVVDDLQNANLVFGERVDPPQLRPGPRVQRDQIAIERDEDVDPSLSISTIISDRE